MKKLIVSLLAVCALAAACTSVATAPDCQNRQTAQCGEQ